MSSGANIGDGSPDGIGDAPTDLDAWSKLYLGWLDEQGDKGPFYEIVDAGEDGTGAPVRQRRGDDQRRPGHGRQPAGQRRRDTFGDPSQGDCMWYSGQGSNLENTMTKTVPATAGTLTAQLNYETEAEYDYIYVEASSDGTTFAPGRHQPVRPPPATPVTTRTTTTRPGSASPASSDGAWVQCRRDPPGRHQRRAVPLLHRPGGHGVRCAGRRRQDRRRLDRDRRERRPRVGRSTASTRTNGAEVNSYYNAYIVENRQYDDYDSSLRTAYNFGFLGTTRPDWVETYPYQNGALIWYLNDEFNGRATSTTTSATTLARVSCCRWTPTRSSTTGRTAP